MYDYRGTFEVHVTVHVPREEYLGRFRDWCAKRGLKCVHIVLSRGEQVRQPMATWRRGDTVLPAVLDEANRHAADLTHAGTAVSRVKIEAAPHNEDVPVRDADAAAHAAENYFEHHVKLLRDQSAPREALVAACEPLGAHLSRNAFRRPAAGMEERFVTLRSYGVGRATSEQELARLLDTLMTLGEQVIERESEYCVYDSNLELDAGWLAVP